MIIDGDEAKKTIPEFGNGVGANAVHIESKLMADHLTEQAIQQGENILLPKVGHRLDKIKSTLQKLKDKGYKTEIVHIDVSPDEAFKRMINRFLDTGRLINIDFLNLLILNQNKYIILRKEILMVMRKSMQTEKLVKKKSQRKTMFFDQDKADDQGEKLSKQHWETRLKYLRSKVKL